MKKLILSILLTLLCICNLLAQTITLSFNGADATGSPITIEKVHVLNLSNDTDTVVNGNRFVLGATGVGEWPMPENIDIQNYPNPFSSETSLVVHSPFEGPIHLVAYRMDGRAIARYSGQLASGTHTFEFTSGVNGVILIDLVSGACRTAVKMICTKPGSESRIEYRGQSAAISGQEDRNKSQAIFRQGSFDYQPGDLLEFVGYSGSLMAMSLFDSPIDNSSYTFQFTQRYVNLISHGMFTTWPCNVNILFSAENENAFGIDYLNVEDFEVKENDVVMTVADHYLHLRKMEHVPYSLKTVLLIDHSTGTNDQLVQVKTAVLGFIQSMMTQQQVAIYSFSESARLIQDFTSDNSLLEEAINSITEESGNRNLYGSVIGAAQSFENVYTEDLVEEGQIVLITNGLDEVGSNTLEETKESLSGKRCFVVGVGSDPDDEVLRGVASQGRYYSDQDFDGLNQILDEIRYDILRQAQSFYQVNYMTMERRGREGCQVQVMGNINVSETNRVGVDYTSTGLTSANHGVFINARDYMRYGPGVVSINKNNDPINLWANTVGFSNWPDYNWSESWGNGLSIYPDQTNPSSVMINGIDPEMWWTEVTVSDQANGYSNQIIVTNSHTTTSKDGVVISYDVCGEGDPTLVFIPGWSNYRIVYDGQLPAFYSKYRMVRIDLAGYGDSGNNREEWTVASMADDVEAVVNQMNLDNFILIGFSMGGMVATQVAERLDQRLKGIVLVDVLQNTSYSFAENVEYYMRLVTTANLSDVQNEFNNNQTHLAKRLMAMTRETSQTGWREMLIDVYHFWNVDWPGILEKLTVPVRAISTTAGDIEGWRQFVPSYDVKLITGSKHYVHWEKPELFNQYLEEWVQEIMGN